MKVEHFTGAKALNRADDLGRLEVGRRGIPLWTQNFEHSVSCPHCLVIAISIVEPILHVLHSSPKPVQQPLPIWVGAPSTPAAQRAARHDASLLLIDVGGNAGATYATYASTLRERGRDPRDFGVHGMMLDAFFISDDPERTRERIRPFVEFDATAMAGWYEESARSGHDPVLLDLLESGKGMRPPGLEEMVVPDASHSIRAIERKLEEAPYTHLVFGGGNTTPSGLPADEMLPYLERFAREVIPHFR